MKEIKKALTFRASSIGDCLMGKYYLESVHQAYPDAKLALVVSSRGEMIRDLLSGSPYIEVIEASRRNLRGLLHLFSAFYASDLVLTQYAGKKGGRFSLATKLAARLLARRGSLLGFSDASGFTNLVYDHVVPLHYGEAPAELERKALEAIGIRATLAPTLAAQHPRPSGPYVVVHMFAGNAGRGLSPQSQRALLLALHAQMPGMRLVVTGGKADSNLAAQAAEGITSAQVVAGTQSLQDLLNLMAGAKAVISVDTGVAHMAAQLGRPLVVLASCLGLHWWGPKQYGQSAPIALFTQPEQGGHVYKDYPACLNDIPAEEVAQAAKRLVL